MEALTDMIAGGFLAMWANFVSDDLRPCSWLQARFAGRVLRKADLVTLSDTKSYRVAIKFLCKKCLLRGVGGTYCDKGASVGSHSPADKLRLSRLTTQVCM